MYFIVLEGTNIPRNNCAAWHRSFKTLILENDCKLWKNFIVKGCDKDTLKTWFPQKFKVKIPGLFKEFSKKYF